MSLWRAALAAFGVIGLLLVTASPVGAQASVDVQPAVVQPGATVSVTGVRGFASGPAIEVRLDDVNGPVLATSPSAQSAFGPIEVTIPAETKVGPHVLVVTQALRRTDSGIRGLPARAAIQVTGPGGLPARGEDLVRPVQGLPAGPVVEKGSGPTPATLVLFGLGVAVLVLAAAVPIAMAAGRRGRARSAQASEGPP